MKVFVSGPMAGYPNNNKEAFDKAEKELVNKGYSVFNPAWLLLDKEWERKDIWPIDLAALSACDAIYQLPGWEDSVGAKMEYKYAVGCGKFILPYNLTVGYAS